MEVIRPNIQFKLRQEWCVIFSVKSVYNMYYMYYFVVNKYKTPKISLFYYFWAQ